MYQSLSDSQTIAESEGADYELALQDILDTTADKAII